VLEIGSGGAIPGFDKALHCMEVNETKKFTLSPEEAYGEYDPAMLVSMPIGFIPTGEKASVGERVTLFDGGQYFQATIADMNATNVTFDLNSPLAGKALTFEVTVRGINDQQLIDSLSVMVEPEKKSVHTNLSYEDLFRYNEDYIGDMVQYSGKVIQMMEESDKSYSYRIAIDDNSDQILYAFGYEGSRVLENDNVIIIGEVVGLEKYQTVLGSQKIIPKIKASSITVTHKP
jgi:FKBP-type peptidyl-prolyl cis-trans isomerase 2